MNRNNVLKHPLSTEKIVRFIEKENKLLFLSRHEKEGYKRCSEKNVRGKSR